MTGVLRIGNIEVHPAANLFPQMVGDDLEALQDSIRANGVRIPVVFFDGKLIDGRNRVRASLMEDLDLAQIPRRTLPEDTDPFEWAWDANCSRLDYSPAVKAAIRLKVDEASGDLARLREERAKAANRSRSEKLVGSQNAAQTKSADSRPSREGPPTPHRESPVAKEVAEKAGVSRSTVERVQRMKREDPAAFEELAAGRVPARKKSDPSMEVKHWMVPRHVPSMAAFLRMKLNREEMRELIRLLNK